APYYLSSIFSLLRDSLSSLAATTAPPPSPRFHHPPCRNYHHPSISDRHHIYAFSYWRIEEIVKIFSQNPLLRAPPPLR
ncbi:hypothetical protein SOVF_139160, partial [Spinacia oleracea]